MPATETVIHHDVMLRRFTGLLTELLSEDGVNEVMINRPHDVFVEKNGVISRFEDKTKHFTYDNLLRTARLIAGSSSQKVDAISPLLSASLPDGERVQVVLPPACKRGSIALSIRKPNPIVFSLEDYWESGAFKNTRRSDEKRQSKNEKLLGQYYQEKDFYSFLKVAVKARKNIIVAGGTSSGKTTLANALIRYISNDDRIITIEDAEEARIMQPNYVNLYFSKGGQGKSRVDVADLVQACLRLNPTRIILSELRGAEAFDFLNAINTGHDGAITSVHSNSAESVYDRLVTMIKQSDQGRDMPKPEIIDYCRSVIDVIVHFEKVDGKRLLSEVHYEQR